MKTAEPHMTASQPFSLVTVVIPVYNGSDHLGASIRSALAQTWPRTEVLVIDDGSDDAGRTEAVAAGFGDNIRYISKPNGGVGSALNLGFKEMRGEYFSWLSHDDLYDPRKVEKQMVALRDYPPGTAAFSDFDCINPDGSFLSRTYLNKLFDPERPLWAVLEGLMNGCTMLLPKICIDALGDFEPGLFQSQDYEYWYRLTRRFRLIHVPGALVRYRVHPNQGSQTPRHIDEASLLWMDMLERLDPEEMKAYEGTELAFLVRASNFVKRTGYVGAKFGVPKLVERAALNQPLGIIAPVFASQDAFSATAFFHAAGLPLRYLFWEQSTDPLQSLSLLHPKWLAQHGYSSRATSIRTLVGDVLQFMDMDLFAFAPATTDAGRLRLAYEKMVSTPALGGLLLLSAESGAASAVLESLQGAVLRRAVLQTAVDRSFARPEGFLEALGISTQLTVWAA